MSTNHTPTRAKRRLALAGASSLLALLGAGCATALPINAIPAGEPTVSSTASPTVKPPCSTAIVTVRWDESTACDVSPPQRLDVYYDESYDPAWGSDASVEAAADECNDMGGEPIWHNNDGTADSPYYLMCEDVDY
jgi:hypothetical protein